MEKNIIKVPKNMHKSYASSILTRSQEDIDAGVYTMSFASKEPYLRFFGYEITDPDLIDYSRLNQKSPILFNHKRDEYIGVIEKAYTENGLGIVRFRFGTSPQAKQIQADVDAGVLSNVSFGYSTTDAVEVGTKDGIKVFNCATFPFEISIVTVPADITVGFKSADETGLDDVVEMEAVKSEEVKEIEEKEKLEKEKELKIEEEKNQQIIEQEANEKAENEKKLEKEKESLDNIKNKTNNENIMEKIYAECLSIAKKSKSEDLYFKYFENEGEKTVDGFKDFLIENKTSQPARVEPSTTEKQESQTKSLTIGDAIKSLRDVGSLTDEQRIAQNTTMKNLGFQKSSPNAIVLSAENFLKDITVANPASAGVLAQNGYVNTFIANVSDDLVLAKLGVKFINARGTGSATIPVDHRGTDLSDAYKAEKGNGKDFEVKFSNVVVEPFFIQGRAVITKEMLSSSSVDISAYAISAIRNELLRAIEVNFLGLAAKAGLLNNAQVPVVNIAELTFANIVALRSVPRKNRGVINSNATAFLTDYTVSDIIETTPKTVQDFLLSSDGTRVAGQKIVSTNMLDTVENATQDFNYLIFGDWSQSAVVVWDGIEVTLKFDHYDNGDALLRADARIGVAIIRPESFVIGKVANNTGA